MYVHLENIFFTWLFFLFKPTEVEESLESEVRKQMCLIKKRTKVVHKIKNASQGYHICQNIFS